MRHQIRHPLARKRNGFCGLNLGTFARRPREIVRYTYREMRRDGVSPMMARSYILNIVMASDWPE